MRSRPAPRSACAAAAAIAVGGFAALASLAIAAPLEPPGAQRIAAGIDYPMVTGGRPILFPADYGSHPQFRTEWWYVTGWLTTRRGESLGFQVTFFRTRPDIDESNKSAFTPRQLLIAHCAISDPTRGRLWTAQRIVRAGFGLAEATTGDTNVWIGRWRLQRDGAHYRSAAAGEDFSLDLQLTAAQPPMLNGTAGYSRKGPSTRAASYYYSIPHLRVQGRIQRAGRSDIVEGEAWLDHEWSSDYLDPQAVGWDWIGINLDDGGALMAFRIRGADGQALWSGGTLRGADGRLTILQPGDIEFSQARYWVSPRTAIRYPIAQLVRAGTRQYELQPLLDDQENDARLSTGAIYWEGAVRAFRQQRLVGRGYLELTGYGQPLRLP